MKDFHLGVGPFMKDKNSTSKMMIHLLISLMPIIIFAFIKNGVIPYMHGFGSFISMFYPLVFIIIGSFTSVITEIIYTKFALKKSKEELKKYLKYSYSIFPGLFLSLVLPINTPLFILVFGGIIATLIGKIIFGGFGNNVFNPALIGALFVLSIYSVTISNNGGYLNKYEVDTISSATPLSVVYEGVPSYETLVKPYGSLLNFFIGTIPGTLGETSTLLCLVAFIYLSIFKVIKWKIPVFYIMTVFIMTYMIGGLNDLGIWYPLFQIMSGGLMFGAVFMATDPVTSPTTPIGQVLYGLSLGVLTVVFRFLTPFPEGVMTSILTMNMLVFILDKIGSRSRVDFSKAILSFVIVWSLLVYFSVNIAGSFEAAPSDTNFNIIEKKVVGGDTRYQVTQKGFAGLIKAEIIFRNDHITEINIIEENESYYQKIIDADYINKLITSQNQISNVDTVSGATVSSTALKNMVINTLKDYKGDK